MLGGAGTVASPKLAEDGERVGIGFRLPTDLEARANLEAQWSAGVRYFDTAPWYGRGQSELRLGRFLYDIKPRSSFALSTKVGRVLSRPTWGPDGTPPAPPSNLALAGWKYTKDAWGIPEGVPGGLEFDHRHDYTYDGIMRSYEDSMQRLGMNSIDILVIHDLDKMHFPEAGIAHHMGQLYTSGIYALEELKASGEIQAYGAGINHTGTMSRYLDHGFDLDFFLVSQVYSLMHHGHAGAATQFCDPTAVEQGGSMAELARAQEAGMGVINATPFNAGIGVTGANGGNAICNYRPATEEELARVAAIEAVLKLHGVPLAAASLQFPLAHPIVSSVICGFGSADEARQCIEWLNFPIPGEVWDELKSKGLIGENAPTPA